MSSLPPEGFRLRAVRLEDADAVGALIAAHDASFGNPPDGAEDVRDDWRQLDLEHSAWLLEHERGLAAYAALYARRPAVADGYVLPAFRGRGLGRTIVALTERRARELGAGRLVNAVLTADRAATRLLEGQGYRDVRHFWRMAIDLHEPPAPASWPAGLVAEAFDPAEAQAFHAALEDAFADHWDHHPETFEGWSARRIDDQRADPTLWRVVHDGDEIAATLICDWKRMGDSGWIAAVGVRRRWRRRGLGFGLLLEALGEFYRRGERRVQLGVDAASPTGATRLYERAGLRVIWESAVYEKELD